MRGWRDGERDDPRTALSTDGAVPDWFTRALEQPSRRHDLDVADASIRLRSWGEPGRPGVVLVHGGAAHGGWWDHIGPYLAQTHHVIAVDLSGHGDSAHRPAYHLDLWCQEVAAAARLAASGGPPPVVVGHSMGGRISVVLAADEPGRVGGLVLVDSPLGSRVDDEELLARRRRPTRIYDSAEDAVARWVSLPPQPGTLPFVREHVARHSVREVQGGWTWKFDPMMFGNASDLADAPQRVRCPMVLLRSEFGIIPPARAEQIRERLGDRITLVELPAAGHHPMLDQPLLLVGMLRYALAGFASGIGTRDA